MCDYSLAHVASRPAAVGDKLVSTSFIGTVTRGFAEPRMPNVAVCLLPGTEIAFERDVAYYDLPGFPTQLAGANVARFRQVNLDKPHNHHDALEFPDGKVVVLAALVEGQRATVLQLPVDPAKRADLTEARPLNEALPADMELI